MPKTILLIENDAPFAEEMSGALETMGYQVRVTGDGKDGLELAKVLKPDAIVLCVELPKLSGYSICNKLKKDDELKSIPLVLTSSEATEEVFEDHRKLKVRAEDYLIKPFVSAALLQKVVAMIGMPEGGGAPVPSGSPVPEVAADGGDEEVVSLEDATSLEPFTGEPGVELPMLDLDSLPDEPAVPAAAGGDLEDDLKLLDDAFDSLSAPAAPPAPAVAEPPSDTSAADASAAEEAIEKALGVDRPVTSEDLEASTSSLPLEAGPGDRGGLDDLEEEAVLALAKMGDTPGSATTSAFDALDALGGAGDRSAVPSGKAFPATETLAGGAGEAVATAAGAAAGALGLAGRAVAADLARLEAELAERRTAMAAREAALRELRAKLHEAESALSEREAEAASFKARGDTLAAQARKAEADARAAREEARLGGERAHAAEAKAAADEERRRAAEQDTAGLRRAAEQSAAALAAKSAELVAAQAAVARLAAVDRDVERLEAELVVARGEVDAVRSEAERRAADLKRRITELEAANTKNEERVVKAYLKIKGDEKVRDKARKALSIALQLLEEGLPADPAGEKRPRPVPE